MVYDESHDEIIFQKKLPRVGDTVRSRQLGTMWRVMEKREVWQNIPDDPQSGEPRIVPAIYLLYWEVQPGAMPGVGKLMGYAYTLHDNTFETNWEVTK